MAFVRSTIVIYALAEAIKKIVVLPKSVRPLTDQNWGNLPFCSRIDLFIHYSMRSEIAKQQPRLFRLGRRNQAPLWAGFILLDSSLVYVLVGRRSLFYVSGTLTLV